MPLADFFSDLQQIEKAASGTHGALILDAFMRHSPFDVGAVYLRDGRDPFLRLAAKSHACEAPDTLEAELELAPLSLRPEPRFVIPIRTTRESHGLIALSGEGDGDEALLLAAGAFLGMLLTNQRLAHEAREGDFQLKYRLWELESLYEIGLSIAGTLNIEELSDAILLRMISLTNARRGALYLRSGSQFTLDRVFGDMEPLSEELARNLVSSSLPIALDEGRFVAVPIQGNNEIIGVLAAADRETREGGIGAFEANDLRLLGLFANQVAIALENARLHHEALEKQAMQRELDLAATIQRDILPKAIPEVEGLEIATLSRPARQVGGDYHAYFERDGVVTLLVADVAGKSMPAALLVSALHAALQLLFGEGRELGDIATELNRHIHNWSAENKFVTMIMVSIDRENEIMEFVNAGHNPSYVVTGTEIDMLKSHGLPIGILGKTVYSTQRRPFASGSLVVLYSDGITEAENVEGEEFENHRLEDLLREDPAARPAALRERIAAAVDTFVGAAPQKDDMTLVIARSA